MPAPESSARDPAIKRDPQHTRSSAVAPNRPQTGPVPAPRRIDESGVLVATGGATIDDDDVFGLIDAGRR
jgi:hypothetical protein